ncbi:uncharacterized protein LOC124500339 isoform X1 [Dermatophagoides farinae]|uniref:uncharacterized protein LOC124500339 isoform X1 n=1 Tax=Dermatophagoides farinae TaxID=6954 RepID=UPI003F640C7E
MIQFDLNSFRPYCIPLPINVHQAEINHQNQPSNSSGSQNGSNHSSSSSSSSSGESGGRNGIYNSQLINLIKSPTLTSSSSSPPSASRQRSTTISSQRLQMKKMATKSSFPKRVLYYRIIGPLMMLMIIASISISMLQKCTQQPITSEWKVQSFQIMMITDQNEQEQMINHLIGRFYLKLNILHSISLLCILLIIIYCYVDFVPKKDVDLKYFFHFISIIIVFIVSISTLYASYVAYQRPCSSSNRTICCKIIGSSGSWYSNDQESFETAINMKETSMIAIMVLDLFIAIILMMTTFIYFHDVRQDAARCGYLYRVHNENYIVR